METTKGEEKWVKKTSGIGGETRGGGKAKVKITHWNELKGLGRRCLQWEGGEKWAERR